MSIKFDFTNFFHSNKINAGISKAKLENLRSIVELAHMEIENDYKSGNLGFIDLPDYDVSKINDFVDSVQGDFDDFVVLGIGGSALGNKAIYSAFKEVRNLKKRLFVVDNVDPQLLHQILDQINWDRTLFNVITKSGTTAETTSLFMIILQMLKEKFPVDYNKRMVITTDKEKGFLREFADRYKFKSFVVPGNVGGRFSVLSDVGLLSTAFVGIDIGKILAGAKAMRKKCQSSYYAHNPAYMNGLFHYLFMNENKNISVMMPYSNSLYDMADWYRQLWAESLGKQKNRYGVDVYVGQTPVKALGTTDQHSQVQLYTEGPNDKIFTFLTVENTTHNFTIPNLFTDNSKINYLNNKTLQDLLNTERLATEVALYKANRPNQNIIFPEITEENIGEFIYAYELQTVFVGKLLEIDPLNQPGVETGKIATYAMMGREGFSEERKDIEKYIKEKKERGFTL